MTMTLLVLLSTLSVVSAAPQYENADQMKVQDQTQLDGTKWNISAITKEKKASPNEKKLEQILSFNSGQLQVEGILKSTYLPGTYKLESRENRQTFSAELMNADGDKATYAGSVSGDKINGTLDILHKDGKKVTYTFDGKKTM